MAESWFCTVLSDRQKIEVGSVTRWPPDHLFNRISTVCRLLEVHQYVWQRKNKRVFLIYLSGLRGMALYGRQLSVSYGVTFAKGRTDEASQLKLCRKQTFERVIDSL